MTSLMYVPLTNCNILFSVRPRVRHEAGEDQVRGRERSHVRVRSRRKSGRASIRFVTRHGQAQDGGGSKVQGDNDPTKLRHKLVFTEKT